MIIAKMKETFGEYIKRLRTEKGLTLTQLGAFIGVDSGALSKIENGKKELDEKVLPKIAEIFQLDLSKLKEEFISEQIAFKIYKSNCSENVLNLAEKKVKYLKQKFVMQGNLNL